MTHRYYKKRLSLYHDNELEAAERKRLEEHLHTCEECQHMLAFYQKMSNGVKVQDVPHVRPFFAQRVVNRAEIDARPSFWSVFEWMPRPVVSLLLVVSVVAFCYLISPISQSSVATETQPDYSSLFSSTTQTLASRDDVLAFMLYNQELESAGENK